MDDLIFSKIKFTDHKNMGINEDILLWNRYTSLLQYFTARGPVNHYKILVGVPRINIKLTVTSRGAQEFLESKQNKEVNKIALAEIHNITP